jgi:hypothetical protein
LLKEKTLWWKGRRKAYFTTFDKNIVLTFIGEIVVLLRYGISEAGVQLNLF